MSTPHLVEAESCAEPQSLPCFVPKHLSIFDAIALAVRNNPQVRTARLQRVVDRFQLEVARNQFFPQYSFDASATYSNGTKPYYSANPKTTLETCLGTTIDLGLRDQVNAGRETAGFIEITQPLLRGFGPAVATAKYKTAKIQESINCLNFKETLINTITQVLQAYNKLVQDYNNIAVDQLSIRDISKQYHATELRIKAGKLAPTEIVQQQAQLANLKIALLRDQNNIAQDYRSLLILLGLNPCSKLIIDKKININQTPLPCPEVAIQIALCKNIDYQRSLATLRQLELALLLAKDEQKWRLDLVGRGQQQIIRNRNFAPVDLDKIDAIGNDRPGNDRTLIVNLNVPLHDLNRKRLLVGARVAVQQFKIKLETQRQQLTAAVLNGLQTLQAQSCQLQLSNEAVKYSQQGLDIAQKKFQYGRSTMFEVTSLQKNLVVQQLGYITDQISYINNMAEFEKLLGTTLEKWCIEVH